MLQKGELIHACYACFLVLLVGLYAINAHTQEAVAQTSSSWDSSAANAQCPKEEKGKTDYRVDKPKYPATFEEGTGDQKKTIQNLYGKPCGLSNIVQGYCEVANLCTGQTCYFNGKWDACKTTTAKGISGTATDAGAGSIGSSPAAGDTVTASPASPPGNSGIGNAPASGNPASGAPASSGSNTGAPASGGSVSGAPSTGGSAPVSGSGLAPSAGGVSNPGGSVGGAPSSGWSGGPATSGSAPIGAPSSGSGAPSSGNAGSGAPSYPNTSNTFGNPKSGNSGSNSQSYSFSNFFSPMRNVVSNAIPYVSQYVASAIAPPIPPPARPSPTVIAYQRPLTPTAPGTGWVVVAASPTPPPIVSNVKIVEQPGPDPIVKAAEQLGGAPKISPQPAPAPASPLPKTSVSAAESGSATTLGVAAGLDSSRGLAPSDVREADVDVVETYTSDSYASPVTLGAVYAESPSPVEMSSSIANFAPKAVTIGPPIDAGVSVIAGVPSSPLGEFVNFLRGGWAKGPLSPIEETQLDTAIAKVASNELAMRAQIAAWQDALASGICDRVCLYALAKLRLTLPIQEASASKLQEIQRDALIEKYTVSSAAQVDQARASNIWSSLDSDAARQIVFLESGVMLDWSASGRQILEAPLPKTSAAQHDLLERDGIDLHIDTDQDGLVDWDEKYMYRSDPYNAYSSGTKLTDSERVLFGLDPNSNSPTRVPVESPLLAGDTITGVYELYSIETSRAEPTAPVVVASSSVEAPEFHVRTTFSGSALPSSIVSIYIFSTPIVVSVRTDEKGKWRFTLADNLEDGPHRLYVATVDASGRIVGKSPEVPFIKNAEAVDYVPLIITPAAEGPLQIWQSGLMGIALLGSVMIAFTALMILGMRRDQIDENLVSAT